MAWRYILQSIPDGEFIDLDVPLVDVSVTKTISSPGSISGTIPIEYAALRKPNGQPSIKEWGCLLIIEEDGVILQTGIVDQIDVEGQSLILQAGGFSMMVNDMPWLGPVKNYINTDPLNIVRDIYNHLQSYPSGNLGVSVDSTTTKVRVGSPKVEDDDNSGPLTLAHWQTDNLQQVIDDLVANTPFEYMEHSYWSGDTIKHQLKLGSPTLGGRKYDQRFEVGVNVKEIPRIALDDYASEVLLFGAGEGSARIAGHVTTPTDRLRRVSVRTDQSQTTKARAEQTARPLLKEMAGERSIDQLQVLDHPLAPLGTFQPGDVIRVVGAAGWSSDLDLWVRILDLTSTPDSNTISLKVVTV